MGHRHLVDRTRKARGGRDLDEPGDALGGGFDLRRYGEEVPHILELEVTDPVGKVEGGVIQERNRIRGFTRQRVLSLVEEVERRRCRGLEQDAIERVYRSEERRVGKE